MVWDPGQRSGQSNTGTPSRRGAFRIPFLAVLASLAPAQEPLVENAPGAETRYTVRTHSVHREHTQWISPRAQGPSSNWTERSAIDLELSKDLHLVCRRVDEAGVATWEFRLEGFRGTLRTGTGVYGFDSRTPEEDSDALRDLIEEFREHLKGAALVLVDRRGRIVLRSGDEDLLRFLGIANGEGEPTPLVLPFLWFEAPPEPVPTPATWNTRAPLPAGLFAAEASHLVVRHRVLARTDELVTTSQEIDLILPNSRARSPIPADERHVEREVSLERSTGLPREVRSRTLATTYRPARHHELPTRNFILAREELVVDVTWTRRAASEAGKGGE